MNKKLIVFTGVLVVIALTFGIGYFMGVFKKPVPQVPQNVITSNQATDITTNTTKTETNKNTDSNIQAKTNATPPSIFGLSSDNKAAGVEIGMDMTQAKKILGPFSKQEVIKDGQIHGDIIALTYSFGKFSFVQDDTQKDKYALFEIEITSSKIIGPRSIRVGDSMDSVLQKFPNKNLPLINGEQMLYQQSNKYGEIIYGKDDIPTGLKFFDGEAYCLLMDISDKQISKITMSTYLD